MSTISGPNWPYDYQAEKERHMSKKSLPDDIRQVAKEMERLAIRIINEIGSGNNETNLRLWQHGFEMAGAASIAKQWADELEKEKR
jgi:hypothetical protein